MGSVIRKAAGSYEARSWLEQDHLLLAAERGTGRRVVAKIALFKSICGRALLANLKEDSLNAMRECGGVLPIDDYQLTENLVMTISPDLRPEPSLAEYVVDRQADCFTEQIIMQIMSNLCRTVGKLSAFDRFHLSISSRSVVLRKENNSLTPILVGHEHIHERSVLEAGTAPLALWGNAPPELANGTESVNLNQLSVWSIGAIGHSALDKLPSLPSRRLRGILTKCLSVNPNKRYAGPWELLQVLNE